MIAPTDSYPPLDIAVVGHTNVGKTSLLRTLLRQPDFGQVCDSAGTTRHVERTDLRIQAAANLRQRGQIHINGEWADGRQQAQNQHQTQGNRSLHRNVSDVVI